jgi:hypothetical protein
MCNTEIGPVLCVLLLVLLVLVLLLLLLRLLLLVHYCSLTGTVA